MEVTNAIIDVSTKSVLLFINIYIYSISEKLIRCQLKSGTPEKYNILNKFNTHKKLKSKSVQQKHVKSARTF